MSNKEETVLEKIIFASRRLQAPLYPGLIVGGVLYTCKFIAELIDLCATINEISEIVLIPGRLTRVDITMVVNLLIIVIIGGYATFVSCIDIDNTKTNPNGFRRWMGVH